MFSPVIAASDIGSIKSGNFGWAIDNPEAGRSQGTDIDAFIDGLISNLKSGNKVALGFEAPLFVPVRDEAIKVASARRGEGNRSWSAGAGTGALATGLVQTLYIFRKLHQSGIHDLTTEVDWYKFSSGTGSLFIWEAFVTAAAKGITHEDDAVLAVEAFTSALPDPTVSNAIEEEETFSLVGAGLLRAGLSTDISLLEKPVLVIKV